MLGNAYGLVMSPRKGCNEARAVGELAHSSHGCGWGWHRGSCRGSWELTPRSCWNWSRNAAEEEARGKGTEERKRTLRKFAVTASGSAFRLQHAP